MFDKQNMIGQRDIYRKSTNIISMVFVLEQLSKCQMSNKTLCMNWVYKISNVFFQDNQFKRQTSKVVLWQPCAYCANRKWTNCNVWKNGRAAKKTSLEYVCQWHERIFDFCYFECVQLVVREWMEKMRRL